MKVFEFRVTVELPAHVSEGKVREFIFDALGTHKNLTVQDSDMYGTHNPMTDLEVRSVTNFRRMKGGSNGKE